MREFLTRYSMVAYITAAHTQCTARAQNLLSACNTSTIHILGGQHVNKTQTQRLFVRWFLLLLLLNVSVANLFYRCISLGAVARTLLTCSPTGITYRNPGSVPPVHITDTGPTGTRKSPTPQQGDSSAIADFV